MKVSGAFGSENHLQLFFVTAEDPQLVGFPSVFQMLKLHSSLLILEPIHDYTLLTYVCYRELLVLNMFHDCSEVHSVHLNSKLNLLSYHLWCGRCMQNRICM